MKPGLLLISTLISLAATAQNVTIPDANFKAYLVGNSGINTNMDAEIQVNEAQSYTGTIDCSYQSITDLTGIETFVGITALICSGNQLTSLNVTQNTALTALSCYQNQLVTLDLTQNTALTDFNGTANQLTHLDLSQNTSLINLWCRENALESLDLSNNTDLVYIDCCANQLTHLNVANGYNRNVVVLLVGDNPNLTCIQVDDPVWSTTHWTSLVPSGVSFSENCNVGIQEQSLPAIALFPNPARDIVTLEGNGITYVQLIDVFGKTVLEQQEHCNQIHLSGIKPAVYFLHIERNGNTSAYKIVKE